MEGKRGGEAANIWGSGGRTTRALIELYELRTLYPHHYMYSSLSALPLLTHPLLPPSPPALLWSSNPRAPFEGPPFRSLSLALFDRRVLDREYQDRLED